jgi:hypothetical protein
MINKSISILIGDTPKKAIVYQIAERQKKVLSKFYSDVFFGEDKETDITLVHKYGIDIDGRVGFNVFFLHFDPYDIRIRTVISNFDDYLRQFDLVVCLNRKQKLYCQKRNIVNIFQPHGSDYKKQRIFNDSTPIIALVCDFYGGNVKGEKYFFDLARNMSKDLCFRIMGKGWGALNIKNNDVEIVDINSYSELKPYFDGVDILFVGSRYEAGPASFPDAVNSGKYVMATPVGMILDNFIEGESGFYLTFDLKIDIENINFLLKRMDKNILPSFLYEYSSWESQVERIIGVINENHDKKS